MDVSAEEFLGVVSFVSKNKFDESVAAGMGAHVKRFLSTYAKKDGRDPVQELKITVKEYHKEGQRKEYEMEALFLSEKKRFHAQKKGWDPVEVMEHLMDALEKQIKHEER